MANKRISEYDSNEKDKEKHAREVEKHVITGMTYKERKALKEKKRLEKEEKERLENPE